MTETISLNNFISATKVKNFLLDDPILDWLNIYGKSAGFQKNRFENKFSDFLKKKGIEFENKIFNQIRKKYYSKTLDSDSIPDDNIMEFYYDKYLETLDLMNNGVPIIFHGVVFNLAENLFGIPDIIIRSDYINKILNYACIENINEMNIGCKFSNRWHYLVVDIKYSNLIFRNDKKTLNNVGMFSYYKSQVMIYNKCLGEMQNYLPRNAYILGRKWRIGSKKGNNSFDYFGKVDIFRKDYEILAKTELALNWIKDLKKNGSNWNIYSPHRIELFPNMNNTNYDNEWRHIKNDIAEKNKDITSLWNCGVKERNNCFKRKIFSWEDENCTSSTLDVRGKRAKILDGILEINRTEENILYLPRCIKNTENLYKIRKNKIEFYVDFETVNDLNDNFKKLPYSNFSTCIFMIGCIAKFLDIDSGTYKNEFKCFIVEDFSKKEEKRIIDEWLNYMDIMSLRYFTYDPKIYHWSNAEPNFYKSAVLRNKKIFDWRKLNFIDILEIFKSEPICIKGVLGYGLKEVSKALYKNGIIKTTWDMDMDGRIAMLEAEEAMTESKNENKLFSEMEVVKVIKKYNYIDCQVLFEILDFLRC
tara:strand:+ start:138 stop:1901 length:1764 start_codon:yes stop_codon:yes gene_type:complete